MKFAPLILLLASNATCFTIPGKTTKSPSAATVLLSTATTVSETEVVAPVNEQDDESAYIGTREDELFDCDASVAYWKSFESAGNEQNVERMQEILSRQHLLPSLGTNTNTDAITQEQQALSRAYWGSHLFRSGYFSVNAVLGSLASDLHERLIVNNINKDEQQQQSSNADTTSASPALSSTNGGGSMVSRLLDSDIPTRLLLETLKTYEQDYQWIASGLLRYPWDAVVQEDSRLQLNHRQINPLFVLSETAKAVRESVGIFSRRNKGEIKGVAWQGKESSIYPEYYLNDFHFQTDGWLSTTSAERYESSTETLFLGRQDAMQRQTLVPLLKKAKEEAPPQTILEVACGTGRFGTFVRDNFPDANVTMTDLSPYYLEKARENDAYWRSFRKENKKEAADTTTFVHANAEDLPFASNSFDAIACVYLFHELPADARKRAAAEMVRVVKPGGMIVLSDSIQMGDRPKLQSIANFAKLNEPHYQNYIEEGYLPELFAGCECGGKLMASSTKTVSFTKK
jgi:ubiquinone/menaquinone biosynthesis C-methylase UbiE